MLVNRVFWGFSTRLALQITFLKGDKLLVATNNKKLNDKNRADRQERTISNS